MNSPKNESSEASKEQLGTTSSPTDASSIIDPVGSPTLLKFLTEERPKIALFYKAIREVNLKRFTAEDESGSLTYIQSSELDPLRLWLLVSQSKIPDAVDAWVWAAIQICIKKAVQEELDLATPDTDKILAALLNELIVQVREKDTKERTRADILFRLGALWLVKKRALDPWTLLERTRAVIFGNPSDASKHALKAVSTGKPQEFRLAVALSGMASKMVSSATKERDEERVISNRLRAEAQKLQVKLQTLTDQCDQLQSQLKTLIQRETSMQAELESVQTHSAHELAQQKAKFIRILNADYRQLLSDARDALEIQPAAVTTALARVQEVLTRIGKDSQ